MIQDKPFLSQLSLSWTQLSPKNLNKIAKALKKYPNAGIRSLNLSYNSFDFDQTRALIDVADRWS